MIPAFNSSPHLNNTCIPSKICLDFPPLPFMDDIVTEAAQEVAENDDCKELLRSSDVRKPLEHGHASQGILPSSMTPYHIIIGRGKFAKENPGNQHLRAVANRFVSQYAGAKDKRTKTRAVNNVVESIRNVDGKFIKKQRSGEWVEVDESVAREKIGYVFRDLLSFKYKSSSKSKVAKRQKEQVGRASVKLERALRMSYPSMSAIPYVENDTMSASESAVCAAVACTLSAAGARASALEPEPIISRPDLFVTEETTSIPHGADSVASDFDFDAEELMNSPLIDPED